MVDTVYHYLKSNIDRTKPENVSLYVAAPDRIEAFKYHPGSPQPNGPGGGAPGQSKTPTAHVIATMDWRTFSATKLESWQILESGERKLAATLEYKHRARAVDVTIPLFGRAEERTAIPTLPFHIYNFDLSSLNFAFRHLSEPTKSFVIGIADPSFKDEGPAFVYKGEVQISYVGDEPRGGAPCRKYRIDGEGLGNRGGYIWVHARGGYFQDLEIAQPDNPSWDTFKLELQKVETLSRAAWDAFVKAQS